METDPIPLSILANQNYANTLSNLLNCIQQKLNAPLRELPVPKPKPAVTLLPIIRYSYFIDTDKQQVYPEIKDIDPLNPPLLQLPTNIPPTQWSKKETQTLQSAVVDYYSYLFLINGLGSLDRLKSLSKVELIDTVDSLLTDRLEIDWEHIVNVYFANSNKSSVDCKTCWYSTANLTYDRSPITPQELDLIRSLYEKYKNWFDVTNNLPVRRSPIFVFAAYTKAKTKEKPITHWTQDQDNLLHQSVSLHGRQNWTQVSRSIGNVKTPKQCLARWRLHNPSLKQGIWTDTETQVLVMHVKQAKTEHSRQNQIVWSEIARLVVGRNEHQCRQRYYTIDHPYTFSRSLDYTILQLVQANGPKWQVIANLLDISLPSIVMSRTVMLVRKIVSGSVPMPSCISIAGLTCRVQDMDTRFDKMLDYVMRSTSKLVCFNLYYKYDACSPVYPTYASLCTLANVFTAANDLCTTNPDTIQQIKEMTYTSPQLVPKNVHELIWNSFGLTALVGTIQPTPSNWQGLDFDKDKRDQIMACRDRIARAQHNPG